MGTATLVVVCHYLLHAKHFLLLRGQQHDERGENVGTVAETFHTPMGTATQALNAPLHFLRRKHFIPLRGQQP